MARVIVYSNDDCMYCRRAKQLLANRRIPYREINLAPDDAGRRALAERTGRLTFPQILIDDVAIGGYSELEALAHRAELPSAGCGRCDLAA